MRDGWIETTLSEVAYINPSEPALSSTEHFAPMDAVHVGKRWLQYTEERRDRSGARARAGDVLFARITPCLENGKVAQVQEKYSRCGGSTEFIVIRGSEKCSSNFIYFWSTLKLTRDKASELMTGTTGRQRLSASDLGKITFLLPPLAEQKRIVDLISSVDSYIEALQQQVDKARKSRNAVLHELLTKGGHGWVETKLGGICEIYQPKTIAKSLMNDSGNYIVYGANGPIGRFDEYNHENSEVVVTCRGATCGTVNKTPQKTWITGNAMVIRPKNNSLLKDFLFLSLTSYVDLKSCISGSAQPQITREGLSPQKIFIPPLDEQKRIVEIISVFDNQIEALDSTIAKTQNLRSALLSDLLSGNHEIPTTYDKLIGAA